MQFEKSDDVSHPAQEVFALLRDELPVVVPYLADIAAIEVLQKKKKRDGSLHVVNVWRGVPAVVPKVLQKYFTADLLSWKDHAVWNTGEPRHAAWRLEPHIESALFACEGTTSVLENGPKRCRIRVQGDLSVHPEALPGVPGFLASSVRGHVESLVVTLLVPNLQNLARGVQACLDDRHKKTRESTPKRAPRKKS